MIEAAFFFGRKKAAFFVVFNGQTQAKSISFLEKRCTFFLLRPIFFLPLQKETIVQQLNNQQFNKQQLNIIAMGKFMQEFKEFAMKGNVMDMAVGVVIGGAFGKIVSSLVSDIIMPLIGAITGGLNFTDWKWVIREAVMDGETVVKPALTMTWGNFLQVIFDFIIIAFSIFLVIKGINKMKREEPKPEEPAAPAGPTQEELLAEIRDLLKNK
jgi:large conductance mechanosensitive channel